MKLFNQILIIVILFFAFSNTLKASNTLYEAKLINYEDDSERLKHIKELLNKDKSEEALNNLYQYIKDVVKDNDTLLIVEANILLGDILRDNGDYHKSNSTFNKIVPLLKNNYEKLQYIYFKKGGNYQLDNQIDSALVNYEKAILIGNNIKNKEDLKTKIHANISGIYYLKENYIKAIEHSKIAVKYQQFLGNKDIEAGILNNLGGIYYMQGDYRKALKSFQKTLSIVDFGQGKIQKDTRRSSYINIAYAYSGLKKYKKAFEFQDKYFTLNDSINQELKYAEIAEIESKYNVAAKEKEAEIEKGKRQRAEYLSIGLGFASLILVLGFYGLYKLYRLNKKNHALQTNQRQLVHNSNIEKIKSDLQAKILAATLDGRLEERKKIALVLHDNVSALLSAANLHLFASKKKLKNDVPEEIEKTQNIITEASESIRSISHKLISSVLLKFGLGVAVADLCEKSSNSEINLTSKTVDITRFDQNFEIKIFNVINELVNNILKHSEARIGTIKLNQLNGELQLLVFDDGKGFNIDDIQEQSGIGLSQVEARIKALGGLIKFNGNEGNGTRIYISVPIVY